MKRQILKACMLASLAGVLTSALGFADAQTKDQKPAAAPKEEPKPRILEKVDVTRGKAISPEDQAKISSIGLKILNHVSKAQQDIQGKNVDGAKKELTQATALLAIIKKVLPTVNVIDHIWVTKSKLDYVNTTEVQQDLIAIESSIDQLYDVLPAGKAKEHAKQAKDVLAKDKLKGASKAKEELEAVEAALDFSEVDLSVSYTGRLVRLAQGDLEKDKTKDASEALQAVADGLVFFDTTVIDPMDLALRRIWMAKQDYAAKDYKTAKIRLGLAKTSLQEIARSGSDKQKASAKHLMAAIDAVDLVSAADKMGPTFEALWQESRQLADIKQSASKGNTDKEVNETFIRTADQISLTEIKLGKFAEEHAASDSVKKFGERTERDHTLMNKELRQITTKQGIALTEKLDPKHQELIDGLSKLKGAEFDQAYTKDMVAGHEAAIKQFEFEAKNGQDAAVKIWAEKCLPTLREHLKLAQVAVNDVKAK